MPKETLVKIYDKLLEAFGPQHWWPADDDFEIIVGAILTQSVSWKNVEKAIDNLKAEGLLSLDAVLAVDKDKLAALIKSTMYYNQKALKLKNFCRYIKQNYGGDIYSLFEKSIPNMRAELLSIKGIGPETADSIILYAAEKPIFVVDAYTRRIFSRLGFLPDDAKYSQMQDFFMSNLPSDVNLFNEYHALIVRLGKDYCKNKKPLCNECPVKNHCSNI
ncbi:MAG: endonuclease III domain-containing protein [Tepidanaerobacter acetatoxydans]|uniref:endonuclease III domain-containing protein n=1 Tax=Tepidanaerobacter acetatoxydans TaxID=499229 RepID=UPI0026EAEF7A|nr:endonuclease III domain-containing protein [Tepidanaerobacter acetatoxydans]NLU11173.1 endonuclease III domain-containing protein [Tepidanaerobacter acetatoxydans]